MCGAHIVIIVSDSRCSLRLLGEGVTPCYPTDSGKVDSLQLVCGNLSLNGYGGRQVYTSRLGPPYVSPLPMCQDVVEGTWMLRLGDPYVPLCWLTLSKCLASPADPNKLSVLVCLFNNTRSRVPLCVSTHGRVCLLKSSHHLLSRLLQKDDSTFHLLPKGGRTGASRRSLSQPLFPRTSYSHAYLRYRLLQLYRLLQILIRLLPANDSPISSPSSPRCSLPSQEQRVESALGCSVQRM